MDHAHENGVLHRDIKPSNLMLDSAGHLWVADFGLAACSPDSSLTVTGDVLGTLRHTRAPEQAARQSQRRGPARTCIPWGRPSMS